MKVWRSNGNKLQFIALAHGDIYAVKVISYIFQNIEEPNTKGSQKRTKERVNVFRYVFRDSEG